MKLLVVGTLRDVPSHSDLCASFVTKLGEQIVERGHTLLNGCRGSLDKTIAEAADARLKALGWRSESQLVGYHLSDAEPAHRFGVIRISERKDWDLTHPQLTPPEQIAEADAPYSSLEMKEPSSRRTGLECSRRAVDRGGARLIRDVRRRRTARLERQREGRSIRSGLRTNRAGSNPQSSRAHGGGDRGSLVPGHGGGISRVH